MSRRNKFNNTNEDDWSDDGDLIQCHGLSAQDIVDREGTKISYLGRPHTSVMGAYEYHGGNPKKDILAGTHVNKNGERTLCLFAPISEASRLRIGCSRCGHLYKYVFCFYCYPFL